ncbi:MAG: hypothetical protein AAGC79_13555 [Pseudomonadota bacterium]
MALNPITSNPVLTNTQELRQSQESKQNEAGRILAEDVGKLPMNARFAGHTKVFFYQLTNFVTLGILGQIGKASAQSSCMGSSNSSNWARDLGQTYLNATQDQGKVMGFLNRAWTEGIGRLALVGLAFDAARHFKPQEKYQGSLKGLTASTSWVRSKTRPSRFGPKSMTKSERSKGLTRTSWLNGPS